MIIKYLKLYIEILESNKNALDYLLEEAKALNPEVIDGEKNENTV